LAILLKNKPIFQPFPALSITCKKLTILHFPLYFPMLAIIYLTGEKYKSKNNTRSLPQVKQITAFRSSALSASKIGTKAKPRKRMDEGLWKNTVRQKLID
jgi:hypothetical protein